MIVLRLLTFSAKTRYDVSLCHFKSWTIIIMRISFTAVMINRLYLSLKKAGRNRETWMARVNVGNDVALQVVISQHTVRDV